MNKRIWFFVFFTATFLLLPLLALAQDAVAIVAPSSDEIKALFDSIGGLKGAGGLAIVALAVQGIALVFRSSLGGFSGRFRLIIILALNLVGGVVALKISGVSFAAALMHATTLGSLQVLINQVYKQVFTSKGD